MELKLNETLEKLNRIFLALNHPCISSIKDDNIWRDLKVLRGWTVGIGAVRVIMYMVQK